MDGPAHRGPWPASLTALARRWPPFRAWRLERVEDAILLTPPADVRGGVHEMRFTFAPGAEGAARPRLAFDSGAGFGAPIQLGAVGAATTLVHLPSGLRAIRLEEGPLPFAEIALRRVGRLRLAAEIAARRDVPRRRAMRALLTGAPGLALDMLATGAATAALDYRAWLARFEPSAGEAARIARHIADWPARPTFTVIMAAYNSDLGFLDAAIASVRAQHYPHWRLVVADDGSPDGAIAAALARWAATDPRISFVRLTVNGGIAAATNAALAGATGDWIAFLDHDDTLAPDALALVADAIVRARDARIVYTDEDKIDADGVRSDPYFKPDWNRELFYAQNTLNHLTCIRRDVVAEAGGLQPAFDGSQDYDLLLRCIERVGDGAIVHVPFVCYHWRFAAARRNYSMTHGERARDAALRALDAHFDRTHAAARAAPVPGTPYWRARRRLPDPPPLVSLIIPTRDRKALLAQAIDSILATRAAYPHFEILIADNDSTDAETLAYFRALEAAGDARVIAAPGPFNFSAINNVAAAAAKGVLLGFVNNDVKVRNADWLAEMVSHFARADVGAVGAKLLYGDGRLQHAGVVTGIGGVAGHVFKRRDGGDRGPFSQLALPREVTAATAACLLVRADAFRAVGGFDAENLAVAFNDVDLCLKLRAAGCRIVWTPFAALDHFESASRGAEVGAQRARYAREAAAMRARWGDALDNDPYYNPNLTLRDETGGLAFPPRVERPWTKDPSDER